MYYETGMKPCFNSTSTLEETATTSIALFHHVAKWSSLSSSSPCEESTAPLNGQIPNPPTTASRANGRWWRLISRPCSRQRIGRHAREAYIGADHTPQNLSSFFLLRS